MRRDSDLGHKIGPRLSQLMVQSVIAARRGLAPHEARVQAAGLQQVIDRMGHEHAAMIDPIVRQLLERGELPDDLAAMIGRAASGEHQWESRALAGLVMGSAQSALGTIISNYMFPVTGAYVAASPHLPPDPGTLATLVAHGFAGEGDAAENAARQGINNYWFGEMVAAAYNWIDMGSLIQLERRGMLGEAGFHNFARVAGFEPQAISMYRTLAREYLTPADAALAVLRGNMDIADGQSVAAKSGINADDFRTIINNTGEPLGLMQLLEAYRRGIISDAELEKGILESRVRDEWIPVAKALRYEPMSTADAADAALRGHLTEQAAADIAQLNGLRPADWPAYWANQGAPPSDLQLLELWRRGYIDEGTVDQGLQEGRLRNAWIPAVKHLRYERMPTADALDAWLRGHLDTEQAETIINDNGLDPRDVAAAFGNAGNPLALGMLADALNRGLIDETRYKTGFRESRYRDEWADLAIRLAKRPMTAADAIDASVQGNLTKDQAREISEANGLRPEDFDPLWATAGDPLSRTEIQELYNRGLVSAEIVRQALRESRLKDKYIDDAEKLAVRLPEEFQVQRLMAIGVISTETALRMLMDLGYTHQVAAMFVTEAEVTATGEHRQLAAGQVSALYEARIIDHATATGYLTQLHYTSAAASLILTLADHKRQQAILQTGVTGIRKLFLAYRISDTSARGDLGNLGLDHEAVNAYMKAWNTERMHAVKQLTEAQVMKAFKLALFDPKNADNNKKLACERLTQMGYDETDATLLIQGA
jgi:hypothetical protein